MTVRILFAVLLFCTLTDTSQPAKFTRDTRCVFSGVGSHDEYTRDTDPCLVAGKVAVPTLAISAQDDPVCSSAGIDPALFDNNPNLILAFTERGSHLAFYQGITAVPWVDEAVVQWLDAALDHAEARDGLHQQARSVMTQ